MEPTRSIKAFFGKKANTNPSTPTPPQPAAIELNEENDQEAVDREYAVYVGHNLPEWVGFYRSLDSDKSRRFRAKCMYCKEKNITGRKESLARHKKKCSAMPDSIKLQVTGSATVQPQEKKSQASTTIPELMSNAFDLQQRSDWLLTMALVTGDVPFRSVNFCVFIGT